MLLGAVWGLQASQVSWLHNWLSWCCLEFEEYIKTSHKPVALEVTEESKQLEDTNFKSELYINKLWVLLTSALRALVKKLKRESIYVEIIGEHKKSHRQHDFAHSNKSISHFSFLTNAFRALVSICHKLFGKLQINYLRPDFDVYLPNSRFRKSSQLKNKSCHCELFQLLPTFCHSSQWCLPFPLLHSNSLWISRSW